MKDFGAKDVESNRYNVGIFHRLSTNPRNNKHIWDILDDSGTLHYGQRAIKDASTIFFKDLYVAKPISSL